MTYNVFGGTLNLAQLNGQPRSSQLLEGQGHRSRLWVRLMRSFRPRSRAVYIDEWRKYVCGVANLRIEDANEQKKTTWFYLQLNPWCMITRSKQLTETEYDNLYFITTIKSHKRVMNKTQGWLPMQICYKTNDKYFVRNTKNNIHIGLQFWTATMSSLTAWQQCTNLYTLWSLVSDPRYY